MAALIYLWKNRKKFEGFELNFFKAWAKRLLTLPSVIMRNRKRQLLIRKGANIAETVEMGKAKIIGSACNLSVGANSFIGVVELALHDKIIIANNVCINDGAKLLTGTHDVQSPNWSLLKRPIRIDSNVWIAVNAIILPGVHLGEGAVVGAGAVVCRDVQAFTIVAGNPARSISKKRTRYLDYNPCKSLAGNNAWLNG